MTSGVELAVNPSIVGLDAHRGLVRIARSVLAALGATPYSIVKLTGAKTTAALVAPSGPDQDPRVVMVDDLVLANLGVGAGAKVVVEAVPSYSADRVVLSGPSDIVAKVAPQTVRLALLGKVVSQGDAISLMQQDLALPDGCSPDLLTAGRQQLQLLLGSGWQAATLIVTAAPAVPSVVTMTTDISWASEPAVAARPVAAQPPPPASTSIDVRRPLPILPGAEEQANQLRELLDIGLNHPDLLRKLGASPSLGVLLTGPAGCGKKTMISSICHDLGLNLRAIWGPDIASQKPDSAMSELRERRNSGLSDEGAKEVLVIEDVETLAPAGGEMPLAAPLIDLVRDLLAAGRAVIALSTTPSNVSHELVGPELLSRQLVIGLPDAGDRASLLAQLTQPLALSADVDLDQLATRTPGFVAADLVSLVSTAGQQAAERERAAPSNDPRVTMADFVAALTVVHPSSMDGQLLDAGQVGLDDVGGLADVKQLLTESVLWPITYPDTFARLGISPTRGVLLYGPPGCGKTYLVKALAHDGRANVLSVKGAELLSKWVGESEAGVRQLFSKARNAAPSIVFLDEVDALAPVRGGNEDPVGDRVVAALLTELDGVDELHGVVVIAATNRPDMVDPALLRPGRLERAIMVPPPDEAARAAIFAAAAKHTPMDAGVDLAMIAKQTDGYSGADCAALIRESALSAMRRSMSAPCVTSADVQAAFAVVKRSLDPASVDRLRSWSR